MVQTKQLTTCGIGYVAIVTPDLDRFVSFYVDVLGARLFRVVEDGGPGGGRNALVSVGDDVLHAIEVPGADRQRLAGDGVLKRGRVDHFGLRVEDQPTFLSLRDRLVEAGASDGEIHHYGPVWSVDFHDPDGMEAELGWVPPETFAERAGANSAPEP